MKDSVQFALARECIGKQMILNFLNKPRLGLEKLKNYFQVAGLARNENIWRKISFDICSVLTLAILILV